MRKRREGMDRVKARMSSPGEVGTKGDNSGLSSNRSSRIRFYSGQERSERDGGIGREREGGGKRE